uniref:Uncharacterized protein n=1 Tax=Tetradesmus obliquus TaxID=3088 RepID=A0A383WQ92_TETOB|eukprot:jgi/Sobl393_1/13857/SZX78976.1
MGSGFRFSSFFGSPLPSPVAAAALPAINNHILRKHLDAVNTLQQRMLEAELQCRPGGKAAANTADEQDDAPLPSTRYRHMSDLLPPENTAASLDEWKAAMQAEVLRRCGHQQQQQQQQQPALADEQLQPQQLPFSVRNILKCNWFSGAAPVL